MATLDKKPGWTDYPQKDYDAIIFVGRFQPAHHSHIEIIIRAAKRSSAVVILIGSSFQPRTPKNPFTWSEREDMIRSALPEWVNLKVIIKPIRDIAYNDQQWATQVQDVVGSLGVWTEGNVGIIGHKKDETSYYLDMFPQWDKIEVENIDDIHASDIRAELFSDTLPIETKLNNKVPAGIVDKLKVFQLTSEYDSLVEAYQQIKEYQLAWNWEETLSQYVTSPEFVEYYSETDAMEEAKAVIENLKHDRKVAPYQPIFVTVDAVVVQSGHILMVKRRANPGKGTWALPGGFVNPDEKLVDAIIRELREETKIKVPEPVLRGNMGIPSVFDNPGRSLRGRTITHAALIQLPPGPLPKVKGSDDAEKAKWISINTVMNMEDNIFEDHLSIIQQLLGQC